MTNADRDSQNRSTNSVKSTLLKDNTNTVRTESVAKQRAPEGLCGRVMWLASERATRALAILCGAKCPLLFVAEHPRSGGTWLTHMLSDYLQVPFPKYSRLPIWMPAVIHTHLGHSNRFVRPVFIKRDGRDLVVSTYFYVTRRIDSKEIGNRQKQKWLKRYPSLQGAKATDEDCRERLAAFIPEWLQRPFGCRVSWPVYTRSWIQAENVIVTSYEALRVNCFDELGALVTRITGAHPNIDSLNSTINRYTFEATTGRKPGEGDPGSNKRKGLVGDWKNYFSDAAVSAFEARAGSALREFGYT